MGQTDVKKAETGGNFRDIPHTTIAIQKDTRDRLNNNRSPGQCYDEFIGELVDYWERYRIGSSLCGPGKPLRQELER